MSEELLSRILSRFEEDGKASLLYTDLWLKRANDETRVHCDLCGAEAEIYVQDTTTNTKYCLDCAIISVENFLYTLKKIKEKLDKGSSDNNA